MSDNSNSLAGTHRARAQEWSLGMSSTGKEQIGVMFEIAGGPCDGKHITWFGYFTDNTVDRTLESLRHCGWASDNLADLDTLNANEVELVIEDEEYDGKVRPKVKWVNRISRLQMKEQMTPAQVQAFAARLRGKAVASKQKYGAQPAQNGAAPSRQPVQQQSFASAGGAVVDDDIPFAPVGNVG
jgi:hypothetical protein